MTRRRRCDPWVGPWLREKREGSGVDRTSIASLLGRNLSAVARIETGASSIPADDLPHVLKAYGLTPSQYAARARRSLAA